MMFYEIVLSLCLAGDPRQCEDRRVTIVAADEVEACPDAGRRMAESFGRDNPAYTVGSWRCEYPATIETTRAPEILPDDREPVSAGEAAGPAEVVDYPDAVRDTEYRPPSEPDQFYDDPPEPSEVTVGPLEFGDVSVADVDYMSPALLPIDRPADDDPGVIAGPPDT